jgi:hypothetical protein
MLLAIDESSSTFILHSLFVELARSMLKPLSRGESSPPGSSYSLCISTAIDEEKENTSINVRKSQLIQEFYKKITK